MSDLFDNLGSYFILPGAALLSALLGSAHCFGMCGGLATAVGTSRSAMISYQLARLVSYANVGFFCGWLGKEVLSPAWQSEVRFAVAAFASLAMVSAGMYLWLREGLRIPAFGVWGQLSRYVAGYAPKLGTLFTAGVLGLMTPLLPCGWLAGFALMAAGTRHAGSGAAVMIALWLGSAPALLLGPITMRKIRPRLPTFSRRLIAISLVIAGCWNLSVKIYAWPKGNEKAAHAGCHR